MDAAQFNAYLQGLAELENQRRQERHDDQQARAGVRVATVTRDKIKALIRCTTQSDGVTTSQVRDWIKEVNIALDQVGEGHIIEIVAGTVTGPLRWDTERFIAQHIAANNVTRPNVPWPALREHIQRSFLHTDEAAALREEVMDE